MRRLSLCLAVAVGALVLAPAALADGQPISVSQGGAGVATHDGAFHYVAVPLAGGGTLLEKLDAGQGQVYGWRQLAGSWGIPTIGYAATGEGLSRDGRTLVLGSMADGYASPSRFLVVDARTLKVLRKIVLSGSFSFDALSPTASRMYLIQYTASQTGDLSHYVVREYDLRTNRLLPGKIVARSDDEKTMAGSPHLGRGGNRRRRRGSRGRGLTLAAPPT